MAMFMGWSLLLTTAETTKALSKYVNRCELTISTRPSIILDVLQRKVVMANWMPKMNCCQSCAVELCLFVRWSRGFCSHRTGVSCCWRRCFSLMGCFVRRRCFGFCFRALWLLRCVKNSQDLPSTFAIKRRFVECPGNVLPTGASSLVEFERRQFFIFAGFPSSIIRIRRGVCENLWWFWFWCW